MDMDMITSTIQQLSDGILAAAGQPWIYFVVIGFCVIDGFFPLLPSESVVVGLASFVLSQGLPNPWILIAAAATGAFIGDNIAYRMGRSVGTHRFRWMRRPKMQRLLLRAGDELEQRAASFILVARFIPVGRVAVNLTAGATRFSRPRFMGLSALSAIIWAIYSVGIGVLAGTWFQDNHLLGAIIAIVIATFLGIIVDRVIAASAKQGHGR